MTQLIRILIIIQSVLWCTLLLTSCGGGGGGGSSTVVSGSVTLNSSSQLTQIAAPTNLTGLASNQSQINVYYWWAQDGIPNQPLVSIKVCQNSICQTIDNILLDTGSFGLRIQSSALTSFSSLSSINNNSGQLAECALFGSGYTWGFITNMDLYLGNGFSLSAPNLPVQIIDDQYAGGAPRSCTSSASNSLGSTASLGANGILGIGYLPTDLFPNYTWNPYFYCGTNSCSQASSTPTTVVANPVTRLPAGHNNGVAIDFTSSGNTSSAAPSARGILTFGISTVGSHITALAPSDGTFISTYTSAGVPSTFSSSFIDTGSNAIFFSPSNAPASCSGITWLYCPGSSPLTASATIGTNQVTMVIDSYTSSQVSNNGYLPNLAGPGSSPDTYKHHSTSSGSLDWGIPFFYDKKVYIAISGQGATATSGGTTISAPFISY